MLGVVPRSGLRVVGSRVRRRAGTQRPGKPRDGRSQQHEDKAEASGRSGRNSPFTCGRSARIGAAAAAASGCRPLLRSVPGHPDNSRSARAAKQHCLELKRSKPEGGSKRNTESTRAAAKQEPPKRSCAPLHFAAFSLHPVSPAGVSGACGGAAEVARHSPLAPRPPRAALGHRSVGTGRWAGGCGERTVGGSGAGWARTDCL